MTLSLGDNCCINRPFYHFCVIQFRASQLKFAGIIVTYRRVKTGCNNYYLIADIKESWVIPWHGHPDKTATKYGLFVCLLLNGTSALFRPLVPRIVEIEHTNHVKNDLK